MSPKTKDKTLKESFTSQDTSTSPYSETEESYSSKNKGKVVVEETAPKEATYDSRKVPTNISSFSMLDDKSKTDDQESIGKSDEDLKKPSPSSDSQEKVSVPEKEEESDKPDLSSREVKEWLSQVRPDTTKELEKGGKPKLKILAISLLTFAILGSLAGGIYYYQKNVTKENDVGEESTLSTETPSPIPSPTPTSQEIDLTKYKINILNGSGIAGEAGKVSDILVSTGFSKPVTANAKSYDFTATKVSLKEDVDEKVYEKIREALNSYSLEKSVEKLNKDSSYDIEIIVGNKKAD
ncbi:hypothetical protein A2686_05145 [Candidatus Woesebacteria bacterium RIFCSPHIGHO2_01_FULL_38_10]|uniref:LytR/CpsA/Psr regulator C-terminal domain-containing protein n=1 Tax=Candidatus Woesebacteria bacterium RIFCSPLOWO2_01_FULL_39_10b TaxID=1802517 RepID=A0A1F8B683_9BACT|nr:MAG: hypothetical protein A2686_05145 [Candidatus Woesebacteria bacterium RIFCSPHIGHO2_01_FULL_38_10]OGM59507.1 MAG: hypothetical protein A2892_02585 [Candidatus Woesebacteria bacterium RIFCSPLOWO2_01_FULL_39_10b]